MYAQNDLDNDWGVLMYLHLGKTYLQRCRNVEVRSYGSALLVIHYICTLTRLFNLQLFLGDSAGELEVGCRQGKLGRHAGRLTVACRH